MKHLSFYTSTVVLAAIPLTAVFAHPTWIVGQTVRTTSGPVHGHAASVASGVSEYLGIPYAQPPVGGLRFQPPVRYKGTRKLNGKDFGLACYPSNITGYDADFPKELVEQYGITDVGLKIIESILNPGLPVGEDCLTLNIWTKPQTGTKRKAVMVYVHGGSFVSGSSAERVYNGQFFADQEDVVFITINYRLSIFGFPGSPGLTQNLGLLDQRLALEWVRDNIASFGGDPSRITLVGESAGSASVDHHTFAWANDPIVSGVILMSGTARGIAPRTPEAGAASWYNTTSLLGCGDATSITSPEDLLRCMQAVPAASIIKTLVSTLNSPTSSPYSPTIDNQLVFADPSTRRAAKVAMLVGNTDNEMALMRVLTANDPGDALVHELSQVTFVCPAAARAARSAREGNPTWRYRWHGVFPNTQLATRPGPSGAYHYSEVPVVFGNVDQSLVKNTRAEERVSGFVRGAWAAFARDPVKGLLRYGGEGGWPRYVEHERTLARIGWENRTGLNLEVGNRYDQGCTEEGST